MCPSPLVYCVVLYCIVWCCRLTSTRCARAPSCIVLYCIVLYCIVWCCRLTSTRCARAPSCIVLYCIVWCCRLTSTRCARARSSSPSSSPTWSWRDLGWSALRSLSRLSARSSAMTWVRRSAAAGGGGIRFLFTGLNFVLCSYCWECPVEIVIKKCETASFCAKTECDQIKTSVRLNLTSVHSLGSSRRVVYLAIFVGQTDRRTYRQIDWRTDIILYI